MEDANLEITELNAPRIGCAIGSGIGGIGQIEKNTQIVSTSGPRKISPFFVPGSIINMISGNLSVKYGMQGPNLAVVTACTTGTHNIGLGARLIAQGDADVMLVGGAEMATTPVGLGGFAAAERYQRETTTRRPRRDPGIGIAMVLSWAMAPASCCWRNWSLPGAEVPESTPRSPDSV